MPPQRRRQSRPAVLKGGTQLRARPCKIPSAAQSTLATPVKDVCHFLNLPIELRDAIYDEVIVNRPTTEAAKSSPAVDFTSFKPHLKGPLHLANKQCYAEMKKRMKALSRSPATRATYAVTSTEPLVHACLARDMMRVFDKGTVPRNPYLRGVVVRLLPRERVDRDYVSKSLIALVPAWSISDYWAKDLDIIISLVGGSLRAYPSHTAYGQPAPGADEFDGDAPRTDDIHIRAGRNRLPTVDGRIDREDLQHFQATCRFEIEWYRRHVPPVIRRGSHPRYSLRERQTWWIGDSDDD
ncbi:MAG: hypothetical protein LQ337_002589 [Flavoplaca oasis]|nr:MAG: hypothetical protein LQ337_002589 [Flavoplaca oasis]